MPHYDYECQNCHKNHEIFQSITAAPLRTCPACGGRMKRLMGSGAGFLFKGSGFYTTDYRSKKYREAKKKDQPPSPPADKSSTDKSSTGTSSTDKSSTGTSSTKDDGK